MVRVHVSVQPAPPVHSSNDHPHQQPPWHPKKTHRPASRYRPIPLATVELQKKASRYFRMDSETTMTVAEALYNAGYARCARFCCDIWVYVGVFVDAPAWMDVHVYRSHHLIHSKHHSTPSHSYISYPRTETEKFSPEQDLRMLIHEQRNHPQWGAYAAALLDADAQHPQGRFFFPRNGQKDDQVCRQCVRLAR